MNGITNVSNTPASNTPAGEPPKLDAEQLRIEQAATLGTPRRKYSLAARALFVLLDAIYGKRRTLSKFKVLEVVARVPYQAWEQVAYVAVTHRYSRPTFARRIFDRVAESRSQQDNEQWHLLILEDLVEHSDKRERFLRYRLIPQLIALGYYHLSWALFVIRPAWSYRLNVDFEDHAEHEYAAFVEENPAFDTTSYDGPFVAEYGAYATLADLFRQIGHDERVHKLESLARMAQPRFQ